jgi:hypothetical protein
MTMTRYPGRGPLRHQHGRYGWAAAARRDASGRARWPTPRYRDGCLLTSCRRSLGCGHRAGIMSAGSGAPGNKGKVWYSKAGRFQRWTAINLWLSSVLAQARSRPRRDLANVGYRAAQPSSHGERGRPQHRAALPAGQLFEARDEVDARADAGEIKPVAAANITASAAARRSGSAMSNGLNCCTRLLR